MPSMDIVFCSDGAKCKQRKTCWRFAGVEYQEEDGMYWWSDFFKEAEESGRDCKNYIKFTKTKDKKK